MCVVNMFIIKSLHGIIVYFKRLKTALNGHLLYYFKYIAHDVRHTVGYTLSGTHCRYLVVYELGKSAL